MGWGVGGKGVVVGGRGMGRAVSLSDLFFFIYLGKYIVCDKCELRFPSFGSTILIWVYIAPTDGVSMKELIIHGMQQKLQKSRFRCKKSSQHLKFNNILKPPKYWIIVINRFTYINNIVTKIGVPYLFIRPLRLFSIHSAAGYHRSWLTLYILDIRMWNVSQSYFSNYVVAHGVHSEILEILSE